MAVRAIPWKANMRSQTLEINGLTTLQSSWLRRMAAWEGEQATVEYWQVKRGNEKRGIVEIIPESP